MPKRQQRDVEPGETLCPHCRQMTRQGTHGGCHTCGRVKSTSNGRRPKE